MLGTLITITVLLILAAIWWKRRNGKGKADPPSQLKEIKTWHET